MFECELNIIDLLTFLLFLSCLKKDLAIIRKVKITPYLPDLLF
jgi:hypothetical protein